MKTTTSLWASTTESKTYPALRDDGIHVDVAIIGAGITGITAALFLKQAGLRVAVLDARRVGSGVTGGTTAHLTEVVDTRYHVLEKDFGREGALLVAESSRAAIEQIGAIVSAFGLDCGFERLSGYLFTERAEHVEELKVELEACRRAGLSARPALPPVPGPFKAALCFENQAKFHVLKYLFPLAERIPGDGCFLFEGTRVLAIDEGEPCRVHTEDGHILTASRVILATHAPLNRVLLQTKLAHYRSYVVAGPIGNPASALLWDTEDPYHYLRTQDVDGQSFLIVGGEDHKTGQESDTHAPIERLKEFAARFGLREVTHQWSAQVIEPVDGLPFIGQNANSEYVYVATGFSGNGMTFGTLSAMILSDACLGRDNPYAELYSATRIKPMASIASYIAENVDYPMHILSDLVRPPDVKSVDDIEPGDGKVVRVSGERLAVYRDEAGRLHAVSPICTHLGCQVSFNGSERTWDCPCHGSRFAIDGSVINGPAVQALKQRDLARAKSGSVELKPKRRAM